MSTVTFLHRKLYMTIITKQNTSVVTSCVRKFSYDGSFCTVSIIYVKKSQKFYEC